MPESRYAVWRNKSETSVTDQVPYNSIKYKSYNNVIETILCVAYKHKFIEQVGSGDIFEVDIEKNTAFPYFHCITNNIATTTSSLKYSFQLLVMDLVEPGLSNEQQVMSDTAQILQDIIALFRNGTITAPGSDDLRIYYTDEDYTLLPFTERFDAAVTGWSTEFTVIVDSPFSACNIPLKDNNNCIQ
jgi:hypothetical protein|tara:strand:+ start:27634 stop:28194 length:561 start_codon:yes stop_codon:yes gene_type:complete